MTQYEVIEAGMDDPAGTALKTFDTREEANAYVRENEEYSLTSGHCLFVKPTSDK